MPSGLYSTGTTKLSQVRISSGTSLLTLAKALNCSKGHLSRIERGTTQASPDLARRIAAYFPGEITRDEILFPQEHPDATRKAQCR